MKKIILVILVLMIGLITFNTTVYAYNLDINDVVNKYNSLETSSSVYKMTLNDDNQEIILKNKNDNQDKFVLAYDDEQIDYKMDDDLLINHEALTNYIESQNNFYDNDLIRLFKALFILSGINNYEFDNIKFKGGSNIVNDTTITDDYSSIGLTVKYINKSIVIGESCYINEQYDTICDDIIDNINYVDSYLISLDTNKIKNLAILYGEKIYDEPSTDDRIPTLKAYDITEDSVELLPKVSGDKTYCYIYRSKDEKTGYKLVDDDPILCNGDKSLIDDELKSETTYYYKAKVVNGVEYSDVIEIETKEKKENKKGNVTTTKTTNNTETKKLKNPNTGVFLPTIMFIILIVGSIVTIIYFKKKSLFRKI